MSCLVSRIKILHGMGMAELFLKTWWKFKWRQNLSARPRRYYSWWRVYIHWTYFWTSRMEVMKMNYW